MAAVVSVEDIAKFFTVPILSAILRMLATKTLTTYVGKRDKDKHEHRQTANAVGSSNGFGALGNMRINQSILKELA